MKIKNVAKNRIKKPLVIVGTIVFLGALILVAYLFIYKPLHDTTNSSLKTDPTSDQTQSEDLKDNPDSKTTAPNSDKLAEPTTSSSSSKKQVQMTASTNTSGGTVFIRGGVNYPVAGGECYALLSGPSSQSIRKNTSVLQNPASTDCKTISIPVSELASGKWSFTLHYESDDYEGASNEQSFSI